MHLFKKESNVIGSAVEKDIFQTFVIAPIAF